MHTRLFLPNPDGNITGCRSGHEIQVAVERDPPDAPVIASSFEVHGMNFLFLYQLKRVRDIDSGGRTRISRPPSSRPAQDHSFVRRVRCVLRSMSQMKSQRPPS